MFKLLLSVNTIIIIIIIIVLQLVSVTICDPANFLSYNCTNKYGNYTKGSPYKANLNTLMSSISSDTRINYGFYNFSFGQEPDKVSGIALCRGDTTVDYCHQCLKDSTFALPFFCQTKEAIIWYENCTLRYSNQSIFGVKIEQPTLIQTNDNAATDTDEFKKTLTNLMKRLQNQTALGDSQRKFATGEANVSRLVKVYGLSQCSPDLSSENCFNCLGDLIVNLLSYANRTGARVIGPSCGVRHDTDLFYNMISDSLPSLDAPPPLHSTGPSTLHGKGNGKHNKLIIIVVILFLLFILLSSIAWWFSRRKRKQHKEVERHDDQIKCVDSLQFEFNTLQAATDNFSNSRKIGEGSSSIVFKGVLPSGQEVAVKRLRKLGKDGDAKFNNEVILSANLQHKNLVKLVGFCVRKDTRILIYEFVPNGSLDWFLHDSVKQAHLDWETRYKVILGISRGLLYLHEDSQVWVIHRDLRPSNILLSVGMSPKISNFCKASLVAHADRTRGVTSTIKGTYGYMAPEYVLEGKFSIKSDVFSFGIILLEIISGQMISKFSDEDNKDSLSLFAWRKWSEGKAIEVVDQTMSNMQNNTDQITRYIKIALVCIQKNPNYRPTMSTVILMLNSNTVPIPDPSEPGFMSQDDSDQSSYRYSKIIGKSYQGSENEVSMSDIEPR